jgi:beta-barrel assembly-enhancing protease
MASLQGGTVSRGRLIMALVVAVISILGYFGKTAFNPVTEEKQHVAGITPEQEVALGLQAAPEMFQQFGGQDPDPKYQAMVQKVGQRLVSQTAAAQSPYRFEFHVLDDPQTINAFALPGGQVAITEGLLRRLDTEGQLAGVLGHEMGHVLARHGAEHIAKQQLTQGLTGAAVLATYDPNDPSSRGSAAVAAMIGQLVTMRFGRQDELESDELGVRFASEAGYDPRSMIALMKILEESSEGGRPPEFFSTHPNPENRVARIESAIQKQFPGGVPAGLEK